MKLLHATGVYAIKNRVNGKMYVGSAAVSLRKRWMNHRSRLRAGHGAPILQKAWVKYGEDAFEFVVLVYCEPQNCLLYEQTCLDHYRCAERGRGYNACPTAGNLLGIKRTAATCKKIADALIGVPLTEERKAKISAAHKGKKITDAQRAGLASGWGVSWGSHSKESRAKISAGNLGKKNPHTAEWNKKIGDANRGKKKTPEHAENARCSRVLKMARCAGADRLKNEVGAFVSVKRLDRLRRQLGKRIRKLRLLRGLSQRELALQCSVSLQSIRSSESGQQATSLPRLILIARALQVPVSSFFRGY